MLKHKRLFIDKISKDFDKKKDLVLGPWCLDKSYSLNEIKKLGEDGVYLENQSIDIQRPLNVVKYNIKN